MDQKQYNNLIEYMYDLRVLKDRILASKTLDEKIAIMTNIDRYMYHYNEKKEIAKMRCKDKKKTDKYKKNNKNCECCNSNRYVEIHHILPLFNKGKSIKANLISVCIECHKKIHPWMKKAFQRKERTYNR